MAIKIEPIGVFHCQQTYPAESPRQPLYSSQSCGEIELFPQKNYEQGLLRLDEFSHIWVQFFFHHNTSWSPLIQPPRLNQEKVGVFASRAPYRPNSIGLSCLPLLNVEGRILKTGAHDLLNNTPILDIKPYIPLYDSHPEASSGWLQSEKNYSLIWTPLAKQQACWLEMHATLAIFGFVESQLQYSPLNFCTKRLKELGRNHYEIAHRTWRIEFRLEELKAQISIEKIYSGYQLEELLVPFTDPYNDKSVHIHFGKEFAPPSD